MKNKTTTKLIVFLFLSAMNLQAQLPYGYVATGNNTILVQTEEYLINSPTSTVGNRVNMLIKKDSIIWENRWTKPSFTKFKNTRNDGNVTGFLYTDSFGYLKHSPKTELKLEYSQINSVPDFRTKLQNDALYKSISYVPTKADLGLSNVDNTSDLNKPISTATQTALNAKLSAEVDGSITNELQTLSLTGNILAISGGNSVAIPVSQAPVISIATRSLNTNFTLSATRNTMVSYSVTCQVTNPLLVGTSTATAYLQYSTNGGTTWLNASQVGNSSGVGLTVTVQLTNSQTGTLVGVIPINALARIRTATTGTGTVTYVTGTEINL